MKTLSYSEEVEYFIGQLDKVALNEGDSGLVKRIEAALEEIGIPEPGFIFKNSPNFDGAFDIGVVHHGDSQGIINAASAIFVYDVLGKVKEMLGENNG